MGLGRGEHRGLHAQVIGHRRRTSELEKSFLSGRKGDRARLTESGRLPRLCFKPGIKVEAVAAKPREVLSGTQLAYQAGRVPGRAAGVAVTLKKQGIAYPQFSQMVGDARTEDPASYDDDRGLAR